MNSPSMYPNDPNPNGPHTGIQEREPSWLKRNWKWVAGGCLGTVLLGTLLVGLIAAIVFGVFGMMKSSDAYKEAMARAKASAEIGQVLGSPIESGWFVSGNVNISGASGEAKLTIPLSGPRGEGTLFVEATKSANQWSFRVLQFETKGGGQRIDLLGGGTI